MHIPEGILNPSVLFGGALLSVAGIGIGLKKLNYHRIPQTAILTSAFFVASLIRVPLGPGSVHLILNGLLGVILGWTAFPAMVVAFFLQAILFQFGGFTTLGVNTFNMAMPAVVVHYLFSPWINGKNHKLAVAGAILAGGLAVALSLLFFSLEMALTGEGFYAAAKVIFAAYLPVMIIEGLVTSIIVVFIKKTKPEILKGKTS